MVPLMFVFFLVFGNVYCGSDVVEVPSHPCEGSSSAILPHPEHCQFYYDCRLETQPYQWLERNVVECPYPLLFDVNTKACEFFEGVECGQRNEPINACEYVNNQCHGSHCRPCYFTYPECKGLPDGPNPISYKPDTPFFAVCYKGRFLKEESCPPDDTGRPGIYDSTLRQCVKMS